MTLTKLGFGTLIVVVLAGCSSMSHEEQMSWARYWRAERDAKSVRQLIIPRVDMVNVNVREAVGWLVEESRRLDHRGDGIEILFEHSKAHPEHLLTLHLRNRPILEVLQMMLGSAGYYYRVEGKVIHITEGTCWGTGTTMHCRAFRLSSAGLASLRKLLEQKPDPTGAFEYLGVPFPPGSWVRHRPGAPLLILKNTPENMEIAAAVVNALNGVAIQSRRAQLACSDLRTRQRFTGE